MCVCRGQETENATLRHHDAWSAVSTLVSSYGLAVFPSRRRTHSKKTGREQRRQEERRKRTVFDPCPFDTTHTTSQGSINGNSCRKACGRKRCERRKKPAGGGEGEEAKRGPHRNENEPLQQPMLLGKMVLVVTTTLVHLAVLGSGALFGSWRVEDQVRRGGGGGGGRHGPGAVGCSIVCVPNNVVFLYPCRRALRAKVWA